ncbi:MAG TPA: biotin/lipoyl-containing protein, partial [Candidatus Limnocylindrales bacterium]|nr:biotin/lipoyl-containing protein [Candidatus Limnocylindrales bacterium]
MDVTLPDLGENIEEAEVLKVLVREGDAIEKDQPVLELETDKATFELPCPEAGTVTAIHVKKGDTLRIGQRIVTLEAGAPASAGRGGRPPAKQAAEPEAQTERRSGERARPAEHQRPADDDRGQARETSAPRGTGEARESDEALETGDARQTREARGPGEARTAEEAQKAGATRGADAPRGTGEARRTGETPGTSEPR